MDEEERNYCCLVILLTRVGIALLRHNFIRKWDEVGTFVQWTDCAQNGKDLLTKFKPLPYEKEKVKSGDTTRWDLSLLVKALLNTRPPFVTSKVLVKSLECLRETRNTVCHTPGGKITTADFKKLWNAVCNALVVFGATSEDFKKVKRDVKLPLNELTSLMKQCTKQDDEILRGLNTIYTRLEKLEQGQKKITVGQEEIKDELHQVKNLVYNLDASYSRQVQLSTDDVQLRSQRLKTSAKRQTEFQPKLMSSHSIASAKTDEIFTNLTIQHGRKSLPKGASRTEHLSEYSALSGTPIERSQDIFIPQPKGKVHLKSILVTGKAGIGKSLFCQKLVRDWADDVLFDEELQTKTHGFDFVYLLPFRQLNLIDNEQLTLREVLNRCSVLDERSNIDEQLFEYIMEHQEKVLFILDGYDEYKHRESITTNCVDQKHESNPRVAMPVAALLSKLLKRKIFGEAVVMVTSRPIESNELGGMNFEALVEITGFSPQQVEEFIGKYFQSNSKTKGDVLGHVMDNEDLISLAHVPMFCFLICWCMEFHMEFKTDQDFPVNMTEMYSEVVEIFELKHNSQSQYRAGQMPELLTEYPAVVKSTIDKLSKLAVETMKTKMFNFEEKELMNIGLSSEEIGDLKSSGLLTSGPGLRTSATSITRYYCFSHLTLHEYFTARWYVENGIVPSLDEIESVVVLKFFSGLSAKAQNGEYLMEQLLKLLVKQSDSHDESHDLDWLVIRLLYAYSDKAFGVKMIERHLFRLLFCSDTGQASFIQHVGYYASNWNIFIFYFDLMNFFCEAHDQLVQNLPSDEVMIYKIDLSRQIFGSNSNVSSMKQIYQSLNNAFSPITSLIDVVSSFSLITSLNNDVISQDRLDDLCDALPSTNINELKILFAYDADLKSLSKALLDTKCKVKNLILEFTYNTSELMLHFLEHFSQEVGRSKRDIKIKIDLYRPLNVSEMKQLCKALTYSFSPITSLLCRAVKSQESRDVLCDALPSTNINELDIGIYGDLDLKSLRKALLDTNCKVKNLKLYVDTNYPMLHNPEHFSQEVGRSKPDIKIEIVFTELLSWINSKKKKL